MKLSNVLFLVVFCVIGAAIFLKQKMWQETTQPKTKVPVPALKPISEAAPKAGSAQFGHKLYSPEKAGSYGRLSLDKFHSRAQPKIYIHATNPKKSIQDISQAKDVIEPSFNLIDNHAARQPNISLSLDGIHISSAEAINLPVLPKVDKLQFTDHILDLAEASPLQPDSRGCGALNHSLSSKPKQAKVRSIGLERKITKRASIGVEYVYKDGCYKKAITSLGASNMPGDDGVNLRVNMRF